MVSLIETPDILPNNMKILRIMRGKTITDIAKALSLYPSYISVVENCKSSISSITAFKLMNYLNVNFEQFFDMKQTMRLPFTVECYENVLVSLNINKCYIEITQPQNMIYIEEALNIELKNKGIEGKIDAFEVKDKKQIDEILLDVTFDVRLLKQQQIEKEFNINLLSDINYELFLKLNEMGFTRKKVIPIDDIKEDLINLIEKAKLKTKEFEVSYEAMNNIEIIQEHLDLSSQEVQTALGITEKTYEKIINGSQKLPLKVLWRMVALFKVPLELIINIPLYMENFSD